MKTLKLLAIFLVIFGCSVNETELKASWWKYGEGYYLGDVLDFNDIKLRSDTIFNDKIPIAVITSTQGKILNLKGPTLKIKSIETGEIGIYHQK
jgi:hypothetical protein